MFTWHYGNLNALKTSYGPSGFEILAFPCNSFGKQEPGGTPEEILNGIKYVRPGQGYVPNFQMFKKIEVNGENSHPLFDFLTTHCPPTRDFFADASKLFYKPFKNKDVRWNFEKFLIDTNGMPVMRYDGSTNPNDIARDIDYLLSQKHQ